MPLLSHVSCRWRKQGSWRIVANPEVTGIRSFRSNRRSFTSFRMTVDWRRRFLPRSGFWVVGRQSGSYGNSKLQEQPQILHFVQDDSRLEKVVLAALWVLGGWSAIRKLREFEAQEQPQILHFVQDDSRLEKAVLAALWVLGGWSAIRKLWRSPGIQEQPQILHFVQDDSALGIRGWCRTSIVGVWSAIRT